MCIEVYNPDVRITIPYESETLYFTSPHSCTSHYKFLLRNDGMAPIELLHVLYPRTLYALPDIPEAPSNQQPGITERPCPLTGVEDLTQSLPQTNEKFTIVPGTPTRLVLIIEDPNLPQFNRPPLDGLWFPHDSFLPSLPGGFQSEDVRLLQSSKITYFRVRLNPPLQPFESRWFYWAVEVAGIGIRANSVLGHIVMHQIASPVDVWRTAKEKLDAVKRLVRSVGNLPSNLPPVAWVETAVDDMLAAMGLNQERMVDIEYCEFNVRPGHPEHLFLFHWSAERDIRMRSGSPRSGFPNRGESPHELIYEWKSGLILRPDGYPWKGQGFTLNLTLALPKSDAGVSASTTGSGEALPPTTA